MGVIEKVNGKCLELIFGLFLIYFIVSASETACVSFSAILPNANS